MEPNPNEPNPPCCPVHHSLLKGGLCQWCEIGRQKLPRPGYWTETAHDREMLEAHHREVQLLRDAENNKDNDDGA